MDGSAGVTIYFEFDVTKPETNPMFWDTPFGKPGIMAIGDIFDQRDKLEDEVSRLKAVIKRLHIELESE